MDCRTSLVLALGLVGAAGCVPQATVPTVPDPPPVVGKAKEPPRHAPKNAETCVSLGDFFAAQGGDKPAGSAEREHLFEQARREYQQALDIDAGCIAAHQALGRLYTNMGDNARAAAAYQKGLEKHPDHGPLWFNLGMSRARAKDWDAATKALRRATELEPEDRQYQNMLGHCLARAGHYDEALAAYRKSVGEGRAHYNLARMLLHMNQDAEARQHLQAAVRAEPTLEEAHRLLAQLEGREPADPALMQAGFETVPPVR